MMPNKKSDMLTRTRSQVLLGIVRIPGFDGMVVLPREDSLAAYFSRPTQLSHCPAIRRGGQKLGTQVERPPIFVSKFGWKRVGKKKPARISPDGHL